VLDALEEELPFQDIVFFRCTAIRRMQASPEKVFPSSVGCAHAHEIHVAYAIHEIYVAYAVHIHAFPSSSCLGMALWALGLLLQSS